MIAPALASRSTLCASIRAFWALKEDGAVRAVTDCDIFAAIRGGFPCLSVQRDLDEQKKRLRPKFFAGRSVRHCEWVMPKQSSGASMRIICLLACVVFGSGTAALSQSEPQTRPTLPPTSDAASPEKAAELRRAIEQGQAEQRAVDERNTRIWRRWISPCASAVGRCRRGSGSSTRRPVACWPGLPRPMMTIGSAAFASDDFDHTDDMSDLSNRAASGRPHGQRDVEHQRQRG